MFSIGGKIMLVRMSTENFKSFDGPTELSMVSANKMRSNPGHRLRVRSTQLLKYGVVYGANASGKSNLVDLFIFFRECLRTGLPLSSMQMFCRNNADNRNRESRFEMQFTAGRHFYAYGFSALLSERRITSEWLNELYQNGSERLLFRRDDRERPVLGDVTRAGSEDFVRFEVYADDFTGNDTMLFLGEMNRGRKYGKDSKLLFFHEIYDWIMNHICIITPNTPRITFAKCGMKLSLPMINKMLMSFDTGISKVDIKEISINELRNSLPAQVFDTLIQSINNRTFNRKDPSFKMTMRSYDSYFSIEADGHEEPRVTTIRLSHGDSDNGFYFSEESDGTRRILDLMDMLLDDRDDIVYVVDELDRSLHPKMTEHFLNTFMDMHQGQQMQLLFTTHESSIMDQSLFRRDEIWFMERGGDNASRIYSLDRFKERYDKVLSKSYLEGRYGAVPVFSSFDFKK